jgi:thioredoxin-like negative regulator of GroEL
VEARLGEGFVMLAAGQEAQAVPFFEARRGRGEEVQRHASDLGLGEAFLAQGKLREAQVKFASVSALDFSDRYRTARARLRLAETTRKLGDPGAGALARKLLTEVVERFGDTPAAREARTLLES